MKKLNICLVSDTVYDVNGVSRFIQDFAKEALAFEKDFSVITSTTKDHYERIENIINFKPLFSIKMPFYQSLDLVIPNYFKIHKVIKELRPDLLHISTPGTVGLCALIASKFLKIPVVGIYHTDFPSYLYKNTKKEWIRKGTKLFLKVFYRNYKAIFSRSQEYQQIIENDLKFDREKIYGLKAGININSFDKSYRDDKIWQQYGVEKNNFKALYVGRISVEKNIDKLLQIWQKVTLKNKELILVGDKEFELDESFCDSNRIRHLGRKQKETLSKLYASCDCFLFPSTTDTLGQVVMEAMASALPVIVTTKGGPKTFVDSACGFKVDIANEAGWIESIEKLAKKDDEYIQMSHCAYSYMQEQSISKSFLDFWESNETIFKRL